MARDLVAEQLDLQILSITVGFIVGVSKTNVFALSICLVLQIACLIKILLCVILPDHGNNFFDNWKQDVLKKLKL